MNASQEDIRRALQEIDSLQSQVKALNASASEDLVAVVGMGCRFPGEVRSPTAFWNFLDTGGDGVCRVPADRWDADAYFDSSPQTPGKIITREAGFLDRISEFDATFFGISPKEAASMDPQHRLLLEVTWEAFENATIPVHSLEGKPVGVYVGISNFEYGARTLWPEDSRDITQHAGIGGMLCAAAGRISYSFGFCGPSMSVDTACSSSLVTTHLACQAIRMGECDTAVVAGVNLFFGPETHINFSQARMLAPDGRCKTFDAKADGYGRGEGCGVVLLKRYSKAVSDGDRVIAVIPGSAVYQDGPSGGLTVPNGPAQEYVINAALERARLAPDQIGYIEAHGTGTPLGDPIEIGSLGRVFKGRVDPLYVGSVKTNFGHLESAAGIAGLIKTILMVSNGKIPKHCNFSTPSPHIDWDSATVLQIPTTLQNWNADERHAGVSSFSFCGTNAHVIVSSPPGDQALKPESHASKPVELVLLSAQSERSLHHLEDAMASKIDQADPEQRRMILTNLGAGRSHLRFRTALTLKAGDNMRDRLESNMVIRGKAVDANFKETVFLFTGQGAHYPQMGVTLFDRYDQFRSQIEVFDEIIRSKMNWSLVEVLHRESQGDLSDPLAKTSIAQPVLFAIQVALIRLWEGLGLTPTQVVGHSVGEFAAAVAAGVLDANDGIEIVLERGRLMEELVAQGAMIAVRAPENVVGTFLADHTGLELAAINASDRLVYSGRPSEVKSFEDALRIAQIECRRLPVDRAFHSTAITPVIEPFRKFLESRRFCEPAIPMLLNVSGDWAGDNEISAEYWVEQALSPVRFDRCVDRLIRQGPVIGLEVGPRPVLVTQCRESEEAQSARDSIWTHSLSPRQPEAQSVSEVMGRLYCAGIGLKWRTFFPARSHAPIELPNYPFSPETHWVEIDRSSQPITPIGHPLLGVRFSSPLVSKDLTIFHQTVFLKNSKWLAHHMVFGNAILPAAAFIELMISGLKAEGLPTLIENFNIIAALNLPDSDRFELQTTISQTADNEFSIQIFSRVDDLDWTFHASASATVGKRPSMVMPETYDRFHRENIGMDVNADVFYEQMREVGIEHDQEFRGLKTIFASQESVAAWFDSENSAALKDENDAFIIHPALLDSAVQVAAVPLRALGCPYLPIAARTVEILDSAEIPDEVFVSLSRPFNETDRELVASVFVLSQGDLVATVEDLVFTRVDPTQFGSKSKFSDHAYQMSWAAFTPDHNMLDRALGSKSFLDAGSEAARAQLEIAKNYSEIIPMINQLARRFASIAVKDFQDRSEAFQNSNYEGQQQLRRYAQMFDENTTNSGRHGDATEASDKSLKLEVRDICAIAERFQNDLPFKCPELDLTIQFGRSLSGLLNGEIDALDLMFPRGNLSSGLDFYEHSPAAQAINSTLASAIKTLASELSDGEKIRILEVGGGTGATTASVLSALSGINFEYCFSDISSLFTRNADERFGHIEGFKSEVIDIGDPAATKNRLSDQFDLVIAANVVHATADLEVSLSNIYSMIAPGGYLTLIEAEPGQDWLEMVFGNMTGWWAFKDQRAGKNTPLLEFSEWQSTLRASGFSDIGRFSPSNDCPAIAKQNILYAQKPLDSEFNQKQPLLLVGDGPSEFDDFSLMSGIEDSSVTKLNWDQASRLLTTDSAGALHARRLVVLLQGYQESADLPTNVLDGLRRMLSLLRSIGSESKFEPIEVTLVSKNIYPLSDDAVDAVNAFNQSLVAFARTAGLEFENLFVRNIDVDWRKNDEWSSSAQSKFRRLLCYRGAAEQFRLRSDATSYETLLKPLTERRSDVSKIEISSDSLFVVVGGLGGLGRCITDWLLSKMVSGKVILLGRSTPDVAAQLWIDSRGSDSVRVEYREADVCSMASLRKAIPEEEISQITGVIHTAGVLDDQLFEDIDWPRFESTVSSKLNGAWNLDKLLSPSPLEFFVTFGSIASIFVPKGQASHNAANGALDGFAAYRRANGRPITHIQWGPWSNVGAAASAETQTGLSKIGVSSFSPLDGISLFEQAAVSNSGPVALVDVDWPQFLKRWPNRGMLRFFANRLDDVLPISSADELPGNADVKSDRSLIDKIRSRPQSQAKRLLIKEVLGLIAPVLGYQNSQDVDVDLGFFDLGLDSLTSVELRDAIEKLLNIKLDATSLFKYPSVALLSEFIVGQIKEETLISNEEENQQAPKNSDNENFPVNNADIELTDEDITNMSDAEIEQFFDQHID
ncbi:beta-ketoacyl synthase N-terminal-like domain-containing protein [Arenicellales bacterium nBUS_48]